MIKIYTGGPGNGKSAHMARQIKDALRRGQNVISTVPINLDVVSNSGRKPIGDYMRIAIEDITPQHLYSYMVNNHEKDIKNVEGQTLVFLDECQLIFNSREWNKPGRKDWLEFFTSHRHLGFDVFLITQAASFLDKQIRELIEIEVRHRKVSNLLWWFPVTLFVHREEWRQIKSNKNKISTNFMLGRASIFKIYDSYTIFNEIAEKYAHLKAENWREQLENGDVYADETDEPFTSPAPIGELPPRPFKN